MMKRKVLITGGAGYIGAHTAVSLAATGFEPIIVDNLSRSNLSLVRGLEQIVGRKLHFYQADCSSASQLQSVMKEHPDIESVIHFAAFKSVSESVESPLMYYENNIGSTLVLLQQMKNFGLKRLVFSSSCTVYGQPDIIPVTEEAPFKPAESPYGATKQMCERILRDTVIAWPELKVISLRYFNPIGAHPSGLIGELPLGIPGNLVPYITQTAVGKRKELVIFGNDYNTKDGSCMRDFIHVMDLGEAHTKALMAINQLENSFEAINIGTGVPVSVLELVQTFIKVTGIALSYRIGKRRPGDVEKTYADPTKAERLLQWRPRLTAEDALKDAWNWEQKLSNAQH